MVDDPYLQGEIACANVLSDLYALGIVHAMHMLMVLGVSQMMSKEEQMIVTQQITNGFDSKAKEAGTKVMGGQSVYNPNPIIGGVANAFVTQLQYIPPKSSKKGDIIVLTTKPLGSRVAVNIHEWMRQKESNPKWKKASHYITEEDCQTTYDMCVEAMRTLNRPAATLMHKYSARGATDVTGFGILGHADNLGKAFNYGIVNIEEQIALRIHTFPILPYIYSVQDKIVDYKLFEGYAPETSGGLLVVLPSESVEGYMTELKEVSGQDSWIVGDVVGKGENMDPGADADADAYLLEELLCLEVL